MHTWGIKSTIQSLREVIGHKLRFDITYPTPKKYTIINYKEFVFIFLKMNFMRCLLDLRFAYKMKKKKIAIKKRTKLKYNILKL